MRCIFYPRLLDRVAGLDRRKFTEPNTTEIQLHEQALRGQSHCRYHEFELQQAYRRSYDIISLRYEEFQRLLKGSQTVLGKKGAGEGK